ncbi:LOG family protein [Geitlerinema sp. CS-897]|uniref:LOG family protein n=1 Tax=Baaleninema simplex TaxID=2862350 RepID=UPI00034D17A8|nr:LOG family protein [Baaleninema simplex]MDC0835489.1 LOG family protein [Geitlerinema sp. CS-897]
MATPPNSFETLSVEISDLIEKLPTLEHWQWIGRSLSTLAQIATKDTDRLDWKILSHSLQDMERGLEIFSTYRHVRKVSIFGSSRTPYDAPEYCIAREFARRLVEYGFMVITGAGGGIMEAGNEGAGAEKSFGLNIQLPFEQESNPYISGDAKLIDFKYFFTRKLFFLKESDAIALFPGGFGTMDEAFETITLSQTGKYGPAPLVLIDRPGGDYWYGWQEYLKNCLLKNGTISEEDLSLYTIADDVEDACNAIRRFYRVYHSSRYVNELFVIRLKCPLSDETVRQLNEEFSDILVTGRIEKSQALPKEIGDATEPLPRLVMHFNQKNFGRLHQMIWRLNDLGCQAAKEEHPEQK